MKVNTPMTPNSLIPHFRTHNAQVAIVGLGYVGLPLAVTFAQAGSQVASIDLDPRKVDTVNAGDSYIEDVPASTVRVLVLGEAAAPILSPAEAMIAGPSNGHTHLAYTAPTTQPRLRATTDFSVLATCDAVSICVPTPLSKTGDPDISYIVAAAEQIARYLHPGMVIVLESTTYPGTTTEVVLPILAKTGYTVGEDFFLAFSPERVDPGRTDWTTPDR
jgi:UDP-N-acetyl-D-glucosamine dehydrogenase